ncbi:acyltransferase family protein [Modestobacter sp. L9-4]|uniref:acyltransferase family protein n=1 Tax=Modestobacter sp. L9-4 TaxID=2851567 RepID=UPI001C79032D|nr:acyltransferase [Modestobacter sp. L9-4]QXG77182.1 acyltransferase family protein [Modestobacter sp. L9-4]
MTKQTATRRRGRLGALDVLRLLAAVIVVGFHFTARDSPGWNGPAPEELAPVGEWTMYGRMGVPLFFVISGFVLLMSSWGRDVPSFVASRVGRLFPAYWVAVVVSLVLVVYVWPEGMTFFHKDISLANGLLNLTMFQESFARPDIDGSYWTLWYEARFYALIAVLMLVGMTRGRIIAFCALWPIVASVAQNLHSDLLAAALMPDFAPFFAGGMLLYVIYRDGHDLLTWLLVGMQVLFALNFCLDYYPPLLTDETPWEASELTVGLICVACFALVALVTLTPLAGLSARWMTLAGALTYPLYLIHENLGWFVIAKTREAHGCWIAVGLASTVCLLAALALHYGVEKPLGSRLRKATLNSLRSVGRSPAEARVSATKVAEVEAASSAQPAVEPSAAPQPVTAAADGQPVEDQPHIPLPRVRPAGAAQPATVPPQSHRLPHHAPVPHHAFARTLDSRGADDRTTASLGRDATRVSDTWATETRHFDDRVLGDRVLTDGWGSDAWPTDTQPGTRELPAQAGAHPRGAHAAPAPTRHPLDEPAVTGQS